jgi:hypothetical protein
MSSSNPGEAWIWGDYVLTLQTQPKTVADAMHQITGTRQTAPSPIGYPFAVTVYYRKDKNPHGPSSRPICVVGLEKMNHAAAAAMLRSQGVNITELGMTGDSPPVLGMFTAASRFNLGSYDGPTDVDSVRDQLFAIIGERLQAYGEPVKIGPISAIHGHPNTGWPALAPKKGGCAGLLLVAVVAILAICGYAIAEAKPKPNNRMQPTGGGGAVRSNDHRNLNAISPLDARCPPPVG